MMQERRELLVPVEYMTDQQIMSAIRDLDPYPGDEQSGEDGTVLVVWISLLILLIGALAIIWLYLGTY